MLGVRKDGPSQSFSLYLGSAANNTTNKWISDTYTACKHHWRRWSRSCQLRALWFWQLRETKCTLHLSEKLFPIWMCKVIHSDSELFLTVLITTSSSFKDFTHIHKSLWGEELPNIGAPLSLILIGLLSSFLDSCYILHYVGVSWWIWVTLESQENESPLSGFQYSLRKIPHL